MFEVPLCEGERILGKGIRDVAAGGIKVSQVTDQSWNFALGGTRSQFLPRFCATENRGSLRVFGHFE